MFDYLAKYPLEIEILPHINHLEIIPNSNACDICLLK